MQVDLYNGRKTVGWLVSLSELNIVFFPLANKHDRDAESHHGVHHLKQIVTWYMLQRCMLVENRTSIVTIEYEMLF